jgi:hypothetical protein
MPIYLTGFRPYPQSNMEEWLDNQTHGEEGALPEHTDLRKRLIQDKVSPETAAKEIVESITRKKNLSEVAHRFIQLVSNAVAESENVLEAILNLLMKIRNMVPT